MTRFRTAGAVLLVVLGAGVLTRITNRTGMPSGKTASVPLEIRTDSGRNVQFNLREHPHLDYGYAVTSHSSQGQTADRALIHVDTEKGEQLVNSRMAYLSVSRGRYDAEIYTNDKGELAHHRLNRKRRGCPASAENGESSR
jgi:ATP-dependent exoDNAse (exonuclease V) alpha subunit